MHRLARQGGNRPAPSAFAPNVPIWQQRSRSHSSSCSPAASGTSLTPGGADFSTTSPNARLSTDEVVHHARYPGAGNPFAAKGYAARTTTVSPATDDLVAFLAGFTAAEGCFTGLRDGSRFTFAMGVGSTDRGMCEAFRSILGAGHITDAARRQPHHDDQSTFAIGSAHDLIGLVVPFMDQHLPPSHKRDQYLDWRERLFDYWDRRACRPT